MCKIMDPTEKGVWLKNDKKWELFTPSDATRILQAWSNGETKLTLGSFKYPQPLSGVLYEIDLVSMKQTDVYTGFSRDIKIIPDQDDEESDDSDDSDESDDDSDESDGDPCGKVSAVRGAARTSKAHGDGSAVGGAERSSKSCGDVSAVKGAGRTSKALVQKDENVVTLIPSVTVDLQRLSTQCRVEDQCNLVIKLPQAVAPSGVRLGSLRRKMIRLMLEKFSSKDFMNTVVKNKLFGWAWAVDRCDPYRLGRAHRSDRYRAFLNNLYELSEKEDDFVDRLFGVAEKGNTVEGDPVEYLFRSEAGSKCNTILHSEVPLLGVLSRSPPSRMEQKPGKEVIICIGISKFLEAKPATFTRRDTAVPLGVMVAVGDAKLC